MHLVSISEATFPSLGSANSTGLDLFARETVVVPARAHRYIGTGVKTDFRSIVKPRSSLIKKGLLGIHGEIDKDYRGEITISLVNLSDNDITIEAGEKIGQMVASIEHTVWHMGFEIPVYSDLQIIDAEVPILMKVNPELYVDWENEHPSSRTGGMGSSGDGHTDIQIKCIGYAG